MKFYNMVQTDWWDIVKKCIYIDKCIGRQFLFFNIFQKHIIKR